jgi:hypothetical protein
VLVDLAPGATLEQLERAYQRVAAPPDVVAVTVRVH